MPAETGMATTGTLAADVAGTYIADTLLERAEKNTVFYDVCKKERIPNRSGEVIQRTKRSAASRCCGVDFLNR